MKILIIGLDKDLLSPELNKEVQVRLERYTKKLPAQITCITKCSNKQHNKPIYISERLISYPCQTLNSFIFTIKAIFKGFKILKDNNYNIIQSQDPFFCGISGYVLSKLFNKPLIVGCYGEEIDNKAWLSESTTNKIANIIGKFILKNCNFIRTDSKEQYHKFREKGFNNIYFIPFLITNKGKFQKKSIEIKELRKKYKQTGNEIILLSVGRLVEVKNIELILKVFKRANNIISNIRLIIIGDGDYGDHLKSLARDNNITNVSWLGHIENELLPAYYQLSDVFLMSSNRETSARVLYEAQLSGTAVITTNTSGAKDIIKSGITGYVTPVGNEKVFFETLVRLCKDRDLIKKMGQNAFVMSDKLNDENQIINTMKDMYSTAIRNY